MRKALPVRHRRVHARQTPVEEKPEDIVRWLQELHGKIDHVIIDIKKDWEIDGHHWTEEEKEASRG